MDPGHPTGARTSSRTQTPVYPSRATQQSEITGPVSQPRRPKPSAVWRSATTAAALTGKGGPGKRRRPGRRLVRPLRSRPGPAAALASRCGRPGAPRTDARVRPMRAGRPESAANQRGVREEEAGARAARARPRLGRPSSSQARAGVGLLTGACTSDLGCRLGRRDARAKPLPPGASPDMGQCSALARRCGPGFPTFGSAGSASTLPQPGPEKPRH